MVFLFSVFFLILLCLHSSFMIQGMMPIFTVVLTRIVVGEKHTWKVRIIVVP